MPESQLAPSGVVVDDQYDRMLAEALNGIQATEPSDMATPRPLEETLGRAAVAWYIAYRTSAA